VKVVELDNPESVLITLSHRNFISLVVSVLCQIENVIVEHIEDVSNLDNTGLGECSGQQMVGQKHF
jgi:hypothetical protein